jgi:hypothetical protein
MTKQEALEKFNKRDYSWSQHSSFLYNKDQWFDSYILDKKQDSEELKFGSMMGKRMEKDPNFMPEIPRYGKDEYKFYVSFCGIKLVGYADSFNPDTCKQLGERKTGKNKWDKKRVDEHGQLTMYCLMNYIQNNVSPEEVEICLSWIPTECKESGDFTRKISVCGKTKHFKTKRTMADILKFGSEIKRVRKEMEEYIGKKLSAD